MIILFRLLMVALPLVLSACSGDRIPPRPYTVMPRDANLLDGIVSQIGVGVAAPEGVPAQTGMLVAKALATALQEHDIAAVAGQKLSGGHNINGVARFDAGAIIIDWVLRAPDGAELGTFTARDALPPDAGAGAPLDANMVQALGERIAAAFAAYFPATSGPHEENLQVFVSDIANVSGDGGTSLPLALRNALRASGLTVVAKDDPNIIHIVGHVLLSDLDAATQLVQLNWRVLAADGTEIGQVNQSNPAARGSLDANWGETAYGAAAGAAEGIIPLLQDYQSRPVPKPAE